LLRLRYGTYAPVANAVTPDGAIKYADPARAMAQLDRDARLREAGFEVVHFTWQQVTRAPDQVVASIKTAFGRGSVR